MDLGIKGKVAVVTGVATEQGLGRAIVFALAREGANVAIADIDYKGLVPVVNKVKEMGRRCLAVKVDQGIYEEVKNAAAEILKEFGKIDILVNNAAITSNTASLRKMEPSKWDWELNINLNGPYFWTREVLPAMFNQRWGRIVNMSSIAGMVGALGLTAYSASKGGLVALTKTTALEGASRNVLANVLSLGLVNTGIYEKHIEKGVFSAEVVESMKKRSLLGRMAEPTEIADVVVFFCSEKASYITGANIVVDSGMTLNVF